VEQFVQERGLNHVLLDEYGVSDPVVYVPQAQFWNCPETAPTEVSKIRRQSTLLDIGAVTLEAAE
jgi:hypothetical protein